MLYTTCPDRGEALSLARALLQEQLIACANIGEGHQALYHWQGTLEETREVALLCKTNRAKAAAAMAYIKAQHSYATPAIIGWSADSDQNYFDWIMAQLDTNPR